MPTIVVIDNEQREMMRLGNLLEAAFEGWRVLPDKAHREQESFNDWKKILPFLLEIKDSDVILCLDLSLGETGEWEDVQTGVVRAHDLKRSRPDWTFIAFTKASGYATSVPQFGPTFDGVLEKENLAKQKSWGSSVEFVRSVVERAHRRRLPESGTIPSGVRVVDSLGMRSFRAAFSDQTLSDILRRETTDWGAVSVESLTSGYSGAFMIALTSESGDRSLILKIARNEETITSELRAQKDHLPELKPFGARFVLIEAEMQQLPDRNGVYYRQTPVEGKTVLQHCLDRSSTTMNLLQSVTRMCIRVLVGSSVTSRPVEPARNRFRLSPVDVGRLETSAAFLEQLGGALAREKLWPAELPNIAQVTGDMIALARGWAEDEITDVQLWEAVQHGDFNPGNVMIDADQFPVLIDLQRLGRWPLGYDMARLAGLLRIRLTDAHDKNDWLPFRFPAWCEECVAISRGDKISHPICPEAALFESEFLKYAEGLSSDEGPLVRYGYYLGSLWDLIKITSYQDISPFKRAWALVLGWSIMQRLRRDRASLRTLTATA
ncbi:MAG TPA: phosphotransferase [Candidatus Angelobacter sp.]|jgi:hypothetical protein|nr:phosphotransferase [Candidatus Angelobacter sp.]